MPFQSGQSGNPRGRLPGSKNKKSQVAFEEYFSIFEENLPRLRSELAKLEGKELSTEMNKMAEYIFPRLQRIHADHNVNEVREVIRIGEVEFQL